MEAQPQHSHKKNAKRVRKIWQTKVDVVEYKFCLVSWGTGSHRVLALVHHTRGEEGSVAATFLEGGEFYSERCKRPWLFFDAPLSIAREILPISPEPKKPLPQSHRKLCQKI